jgi:hypothetical protein
MLVVIGYYAKPPEKLGTIYTDSNTSSQTVFYVKENNLNIFL